MPTTNFTEDISKLLSKKRTYHQERMSFHQDELEKISRIVALAGGSTTRKRGPGRPKGWTPKTAKTGRKTLKAKTRGKGKKGSVRFDWVGNISKIIKGSNKPVTTAEILSKLSLPDKNNTNRRKIYVIYLSSTLARLAREKMIKAQTIKGKRAKLYSKA